MALNIDLLSAYGAGAGTYWYTKITGESCFLKSGALQDIVSRPFPHLFIDQYSIHSNGSLNGGGSLSYNQFIEFCAKHCDVVGLNATGGDTPRNDFTVETTTWRNAMLGIRTAILNAQNSIYYASKNIKIKPSKVLPYCRPDSVMYGVSGDVRAFWTWCAAAPTTRFFYYDSHYNHYSSTYNDGTSGLTSGTRRLINMRNSSLVQKKWASYYKELVDYGFDGVFADNNAVSGGGIFEPDVPTSVGLEFGAGQNTAFGYARSNLTTSEGITYGANGDGLIWGNGKLHQYQTNRDYNMMEKWGSTATTAEFGSSISCQAAIHYPNYCETNFPYTLCIDNIEVGNYTPIGLLPRIGFNCMSNGGLSIIGNDLNATNLNMMATLGKIGFPKENKVLVSGTGSNGNGFYKREFTGALVLANATSSSRSYTLPTANGGNWLQVNADGTTTTRAVGYTISVPSYRAIILKKSIPDEGEEIPPEVEEAPTAPSNFSIDSVTIGEPSGNYYIWTSWTDNSDNETGFEIYYSIDDGEYELIKSPVANSTSYGINIGASPTEGTWNFKIRAINAVGNSDFSEPDSYVIGNPSTPPEQITDLAVGFPDGKVSNFTGIAETAPYTTVKTVDWAAAKGRPNPMPVIQIPLKWTVPTEGTEATGEQIQMKLDGIPESHPAYKWEGVWYFVKDRWTNEERRDGGDADDNNYDIFWTEYFNTDYDYPYEQVSDRVSNIPYALSEYPDTAENFIGGVNGDEPSCTASFRIRLVGGTTEEPLYADWSNVLEVPIDVDALYGTQVENPVYTIFKYLNSLTIQNLTIVHSYPLDRINAASAAFSVRKLRKDYTGAAIRIRRDNDNEELDIGFVNGLLDTASLATFVGENTAYVVAWYDQSGNGYNAIQTTVGEQPIFNTTNYMLQFVNDYLDLTQACPDIARNRAELNCFSVMQYTNTATAQTIFVASKGDSATSSRFMLSNNVSLSTAYLQIGGRRLDTDTFKYVGSNVQQSTNMLIQHGHIDWANSNAYLYVNGNLVNQDLNFQTDGNTQDTNSLSVRIGQIGSSNSQYTGYLKELILIDNISELERIDMTNNIKSHYGII